MSSSAYTLFDTPFGACALGWGEAGIAGVWLPEATAEATRARVLRRFPDAVATEPPPEVARTISDIRALFAGEPRDLLDAVLDERELPAFYRRVYALARRILPGQTRTYGELAAALGQPGSARAVGQAMGKNPFPIIVPCHRVLAASNARGGLGGFSAPGGVVTKRAMLALEGVHTGDSLSLFDTEDA
jgi:methylated-DNA-[protein]-cysteine S-methyltransferase